MPPFDRTPAQYLLKPHSFLDREIYTISKLRAVTIDVELATCTRYSLSRKRCPRTPDITNRGGRAYKASRQALDVVYTLFNSRFSIVAQVLGRHLQSCRKYAPEPLKYQTAAD